MGYVVEEPTYNETLGDIVLPVDNKGGNVDIGKPIVDVPIGESGPPRVRVGQRRVRNDQTKKVASHVNGNRWVCKEIIERDIKRYRPWSFIAPVLAEELSQRSPVPRWIAEPSEHTLLDTLWERRQ